MYLHLRAVVQSVKPDEVIKVQIVSTYMKYKLDNKPDFLRVEHGTPKDSRYCERHIAKKYRNHLLK